MDNNSTAFLALIRAGLWESDAQLCAFDIGSVFKLAKEQSVVGLVAAGLEHVADLSVPKAEVLSFVSNALQLERRNLAMDAFIDKLCVQMQEKGIIPVLVKGQGIAQCYERPLWRASGDIDLMLDEAGYEKAKAWLDTIGVVTEDEHEYKKRIVYKVDSWLVELHRTMRGQLGRRIDRMIDEVQKEVVEGGRVRSWMNGETQILLPAPDEDVVLVFAHILQHFFRGGIGLRQICDWCRLLWRFHSELDLQLLESRINAMGVMSEWRAFAALAVDVLGMPAEAMPFYSAAGRWKRKASRILRYVLKVGNFGYNRDSSYKRRYSFLRRMATSLYYRTCDFMNQVRIFPIDAVRAYSRLWMNGLGVVFRFRFWN